MRRENRKFVLDQMYNLYERVKGEIEREEDRIMDEHSGYSIKKLSKERERK